MKGLTCCYITGFGGFEAKKKERVTHFLDAQVQIIKICGEIYGNLKHDDGRLKPIVDEEDLSMKRLDELHLQLQQLHSENVCTYVLFQKSISIFFDIILEEN